MQANKELARLFQRIADMLELLGKDRFRVAAHQRAARAIEDASDDLAAMADDLGALTRIDGIGEKSARKIQEYARTGRIAEHDELAERVPQGLMKVLEIPGLGPKTVKLMWEKAGVESVEDLKRIIEDGSIYDLPRMGRKTVENIKESLAFSEQSGERTPLGVALPIAETLVEELGGVKGVQRIDYAGSLRRGRETIGDVDILACTKDPAALREAFTTRDDVSKVLASGETKSSVRIDRGDRTVQVDLRIVPKESYGAALLYFTGSKEHNVRLRERAIQRGYTLNEYGLFPEDDKEEPPQKRGVEPVASENEEDVYEALGLAWIPPELREDRGEVSDDFECEGLITIDDIRCELHAHTTASDGRLSIEELAACAKERGFHTIAVTDHSRSSAIAGGLDEKRLREHINAVREANEKTKGITILAGSEVDILADGSLDYDDDLLAELDIVVASPHASLRQDAKTATSRLIKAIRHPLVHIIGHPTGRLVGAREGFHPDMGAVCAAAAEHDVALEVNSNWRRLDLRDLHVRLAREAGVKIAIDCDVHRAEGFDNLRYGVLTARRGGLRANECINTWTKNRLARWLGSKR